MGTVKRSITVNQDLRIMARLISFSKRAGPIVWLTLTGHMISLYCQQRIQTLRKAKGTQSVMYAEKDILEKSVLKHL